MKRLLLVVMAALVFASPATASSPSEQRFRAAVTVAETVFPQAAKCGTVRYRLAPRSRLIDGLWKENECLVLILRKRTSWRALCSIVTHERGHAIGLQHSRNPRSIMHRLVPMPRYCRGDWRHPK